MRDSGLTRHQIEIISEAAIKEYKRISDREKKDKKDWRLINTNLLLKNYQMLKKHCDQIVPELEDYEEFIFDASELNLQSMMKYKAKTKKMLDYFDVVLGSYKKYCDISGEAIKRRCNVLIKSYINQPRMKFVYIAELYGIDERTIRRDEKKAIQELSVFLFGIDSLEDLSETLK